MALNGISRETNQFDTALGELRLVSGQRRKLGRAYRRVVFRMGEQDSPVVANPLVEVDHTYSRRCLEIRSRRPQAEARDDHEVSGRCICR